MKNWKARRRHQVVVLSQHLHGGPEDKPGETSVRVGSVSTDI